MDSVEGRNLFQWSSGGRWPTGPVAEGDWAAPAGYSSRAVIDPWHGSTKDLLCDHHLKKLYGGPLASLILAVWGLTDRYSVPCLSARDCYPSSKCSGLINIEISWFKGNAFRLVLGAKWWWLILLQLYQWGSSVSYHAATGLGNESNSLPVIFWLEVFKSCLASWRISSSPSIHLSASWWATQLSSALWKSQEANHCSPLIQYSQKPLFLVTTFLLLNNRGSCASGFPLIHAGFALALRGCHLPQPLPQQKWGAMQKGQWTMAVF